MTGLDYNRLGELRIRAERAEAKAERYEQIGDRMTEYLYGPLAGYLHAIWIEARGWDGAPTGEHAKPGARRTGPKP